MRNRDYQTFMFPTVVKTNPKLSGQNVSYLIVHLRFRKQYDKEGSVRIHRFSFVWSRRNRSICPGGLEKLLQTCGNTRPPLLVAVGLQFWPPGGLHKSTQGYVGPVTGLWKDIWGPLKGDVRLSRAIYWVLHSLMSSRRHILRTLGSHFFNMWIWYTWFLRCLVIARHHEGV